MKKLLIAIVIFSSCSDSETEKRLSKIEEKLNNIEHPKSKLDAKIDSLKEEYYQEVERAYK